VCVYVFLAGIQASSSHGFWKIGMGLGLACKKLSEASLRQLGTPQLQVAGVFRFSPPSGPLPDNRPKGLILQVGGKMEFLEPRAWARASLTPQIQKEKKNCQWKNDNCAVCQLSSNRQPPARCQLADGSDNPGGAAACEKMKGWMD
jgi:hypothetical protein